MIESNPSRCRELREVVREIEAEIQQYLNHSRVEERRRDQAQAKLSELSARRDKLQRDQLIALAASATPGRVGSVVGLMESDLSLQINVTDSEIAKWNGYLVQTQQKIEEYLNHRRRLTESLGRFGREMTQLGCAGGFS